MVTEGPVPECLITRGVSIGPVKQKNLPKIVIFFLSISLNICFGCSKEPSHRDGSLEYPQHMFWLRDKKNNFQSCNLIWGLGFMIFYGHNILLNSLEIWNNLTVKTVSIF